MGKSAVLAAWLARREEAGEIVPHHFIRRGWSNWDDPEAMVDSLVAQIEARVPDLCEPEADARPAPAARLASALQRVSERITAEFKVALKRPTAMGPVHVDARVVSATDDRATIEVVMTAGGKVTAIGTGTFVAVKPDHPAYYRW